ncbi:AraC family transcriptional regulator [Neorhizobium alkalisoli]|uniref:AraC-like DNA-binding protein n=1 Tax=Neorhizobium alkalisoli TaxID=528178 RepID=A0A561QB22_9HYPH|nr:helix-turn-helix transcriptional regulator [Neorhizobium alkalisoli]TWF47550.1 AraC-like DNA-binding protein [Neorhizobium alkalisoli]
MLLFNRIEDFQGADSLARDISAVAFDLDTDVLEQAPHSHRKAQLLYTTKGVVTVHAAHGLWVAPPNCAVWVPGGVTHSSSGVGKLEIRCLFIEPASAPDMPADCCIISVPPLLREMFARFEKMPPLYPLGASRENRFIQVMVDELTHARREPLYLPMPKVLRLRKLADLIALDPSLRSTIEDWSERIGASPRTLTRRFKEETGLSFGKWRRQLQLSLALQWLAEGQSVTNIAIDLGYENTSAFITMFKQALGQTPARYFAD